MEKTFEVNVNNPFVYTNIAFVDLEKAFDSANWNKLFRIPRHLLTYYEHKIITTNNHCTRMKSR